MEDDFSTLRKGIIEFVEQMDKLQRLSPQIAAQKAGTDTFFAALLEATRSICERVPIRRLLGRVREASRAEILAAAAVLIEIADGEGADMLEGMEGADGNTQLAGVMAEARRRMEGSRNGTSD